MRLVLVFVVWLLALPSYAATYFVDNDLGNDNNNGLSVAQAWKTPSKVRNSIAGGDTVKLSWSSVHTNRYDDAALGAFPGGSSWASATVFTSYDGGTAEIRGQFPAGEYPIHHRFTSWLIWSNIVVNCTNGYSGVVVTDDAHHIRFQGVTVKDVPRSHCFLISPGGGALAKYVELIDCDLLNWGYNKQGGDNDLHGAYISTSSNLVDNCDIKSSNNLGSWGIHHFTGGVNPLGNIFRNNRISGQQNAGAIIIAGGDDALVYNNVIYGIVTGYGVQIDQGSQRAKILHNTIYGCPAGIFIGNSSISSDTVLENNIVTGSTSGQGGVGVGTGAEDTIVRNNLIYGNTVNYGNSGAGTTFTGNLIGGSFNAQFVNAVATNFALQASSSARNAGTTVAGMTNDHIGAVRPLEGASDIGAYEYNAGGMLPTVTVDATDNLATEMGPTAGTFTFTRSGGGAPPDLQINFTVTGTAGSGVDYAAIGTASTTPTKTVTPINDSDVEVDETVIVTITPSATYTIGTPSNAVVTIRSDDIPPTPQPTPPGGGTTPGPGNDIPPYAKAYQNELKTLVAEVRGEISTSVPDIVRSLNYRLDMLYAAQTNTNAEIQKIKAGLGIQ